MFRRQKCLYDEWIISQRTISKLEKDINKYESLTNNCKQTYLNLSEEYNNLKIALSKIHKNSKKKIELKFLICYIKDR